MPTTTPSASATPQVGAQGASIILQGSGNVRWQITDRNNQATYITDVGLSSPVFKDMVQDVNDNYGYHGGETVGLTGDLGYFASGQSLQFFLHTGATEASRVWLYSDTSSNCTVTTLGTDQWRLDWEDGGGAGIDLKVEIYRSGGGYTISGRVTDGSGNGISGVTITIANAASGATLYSPVTDSNGHYAQSGVPAGAIKLTPSKQHYAFAPTTSVNDNLNADWTKNFTGTLIPATTCSISGRVADSYGNGIAGVAIHYSEVGSGSWASAFTDSDGNYALTNLEPCTGVDSWTLYATKDGCSFWPLSETIFWVDEETGVDFSATCTVSSTISGRVTGGGGTGIPGVTISAGGGLATTTDNNGNYTLSGLATGTYTLTPSKNDYVCGPSASAPITVPPSRTGLYFGCYPCKAPSGLDVCQLKAGDILLKAGCADPLDPECEWYRILFMIGGTHFTHSALYLGMASNPGSPDIYAPMIAEASGCDQAAPDNEVWETSLLNTEWWTGDHITDWMVRRPSNATQEQIDDALAFARGRARNQAVRFRLFEPNPCDFPLVPPDVNNDGHFYCSKLVWMAYDRAGYQNIYMRSAFLLTRPLDWIRPDDFVRGHTILVDAQEISVDDLPGSVQRYTAYIWSPAHITLVNPVGRRTGFNPDNGQEVAEIPGASYSGVDSLHETIEIAGIGDASGWKLIVTGYDYGSYTLETGYLGSSEPFQNVTRDTQPGKQDEFSLPEQRRSVSLPIILK